MRDTSDIWPEALYTASRSSELKENPLVTAWPEQTGSAAGTSSCIDVLEKTGLHWKLLPGLIIYWTYCFFSCSVALNNEKVKNWQRLLCKESISMNNFLQICKWQENTSLYIFFILCAHDLKKGLTDPLIPFKTQSIQFSWVHETYMAIHVVLGMILLLTFLYEFCVEAHSTVFERVQLQVVLTLSALQLTSAKK